MVELNEGIIQGATWLVNEVFGRHNKQNAQILHGTHWKEYFKPAFPNGWLELGAMLENPNRSQLLVNTILNLIQEFDDRQQNCLRLRWGLEDGRQRTIEAMVKEFNVTRERARQIEAKAIRRLRHPYRSKLLSCFNPTHSTEQVIQCLNDLNSPLRSKAGLN